MEESSYKIRYGLLFVIFISIFMLFGCKSKNNTNNDALNFKEEYEKINNQLDSSGQKAKELNISESNPFVYKSEEDIVNSIKNKETFVVYFGYGSCRMCRSLLPTLMEIANNNSLETFYYVNIEKTRDEYKVVDGKLSLIKKASTGYVTLLNELSSSLPDYILYDDNNSYNIGEKRIYAPTIIGFINGKLVGITTGLESLQINSNLELTNDELKDSKEKISNIIVPVSRELSSCNANTGC